MNNLMDLLQSQMSGQFMEQLAGNFGVEKSKTSQATEGIYAALMAGLAKNVSSPQGANALMGALDRDHDGSVLNDLSGFLLGNKTASNSSMLNGAGILKHVLGGSQGKVADQISKQSGMDSGQVMKLMVTLAPVILGMLGKMKKQQNLNSGGMSDLIINSTKKVKQNNPQASILTTILDRDGDGQIMDDIAQSGIKALFGKLFGRKR